MLQIESLWPRIEPPTRSFHIFFLAKMPPLRKLTHRHRERKKKRERQIIQTKTEERNAIRSRAPASLLDVATRLCLPHQCSLIDQQHPYPLPRSIDRSFVPSSGASIMRSRSPLQVEIPSRNASDALAGYAHVHC